MFSQAGGRSTAAGCLVKDPDTTIAKLVEAKGKDLGDTLTVRRFVRFGLGE